MEPYRSFFDQPLVLASQSPRRREILAQFDSSFLVVPANDTEDLTDEEQRIPADAALLLAKRKAYSVALQYTDRFVLAADTIVVLHGRMYGKPVDKDHAKAMLQCLSGQVHTVLTGVCLVRRARKIELSDVACTKVFFDTLSDKKIDAYIRSGEYADKAGAYGIAGKGSAFIRRIEGCYYNVMGLPVITLEHMLNSIGYSFLW